MWYVFTYVCSSIVLGIVALAVTVGLVKKVGESPSRVVVPITDVATPSPTPTM